MKYVALGLAVVTLATAGLIIRVGRLNGVF